MATLQAIFAGKPQQYHDGEISFNTAYIKQPKAGKVRVTRQGIEGDGSASHSNAIYAYDSQGYDFWMQQLPINATTDTWCSGFMGENLTIAGLDEKQLHIGDRLTIGSAVLQISGCRVPCETFLWRTGMSVDFLRQFQSSSHTGFYLEVLKPGTIEAGNRIQHQASKQNSISVAELARFFLQPNPTQEQLEFLTGIGGMGKQMLDMLFASYNRVVERKLVSQNRWSGWREFEINRIVEESARVKSFYLSPTDAKPVAGYRPGQFVNVQLPDGQTRSWSLSDYSESLQGYRISIKRQGQASNWMHQQATIGSRVKLTAPCGDFTLQRGEMGLPVVLISAGVGITPMLSMLKGHLARRDPQLPSLLLIQSVSNREEDLFREEIAQHCENIETINSHFVHTRPLPGERIGRDYDSSGRLDQAALRQLTDRIGCWFAGRWLNFSARECEFYLCGPQAFQQDISAQLQALGVADYSIRQESFAGAENNLEHATDCSQVHFSRSGKQALWQKHQGDSLLELAEAAGLNPPFGCRSGKCGVCRTRVLQGEFQQAPRASSNMGTDELLLCCSYPTEKVLELEL